MFELEKFLKPKKRRPEIKITIRVAQEDLDIIMKSLDLSRNSTTPTDIATATFRMAAETARAQVKGQKTKAGGSGNENWSFE
jgi:hypothetical protein